MSTSNRNVKFFAVEPNSHGLVPQCGGNTMSTLTNRDDLEDLLKFVDQHDIAAGKRRPESVDIYAKIGEVVREERGADPWEKVTGSTVLKVDDVIRYVDGDNRVSEARVLALAPDAPYPIALLFSTKRGVPEVWFDTYQISYIVGWQSEVLTQRPAVGVAVFRAIDKTHPLEGKVLATAG